MIRPLIGQVLVEVLPPEETTASGLFIPDVAQSSPRGEKARPFKAQVVAIGPWKRTKQGFAVLPEFTIGAQILCTPYAGTKLTRNIGERYQLVKITDVLALVETKG